MNKGLMVLIALLAQGMPVVAEDLIDQKTHEYTPRGVVVSMVAAGQVSEMRCGMKGQIKAALDRASRLGVPLDLNREEDFSDIVFVGTELLARLDKVKDGVSSWCRDIAPQILNYLQKP